MSTKASPPYALCAAAPPFVRQAARTLSPSAHSGERPVTFPVVDVTRAARLSAGISRRCREPLAHRAPATTPRPTSSSPPSRRLVGNRLKAAAREITLDPDPEPTPPEHNQKAEESSAYASPAADRRPLPSFSPSTRSSGSSPLGKGGRREDPAARQRSSPACARTAIRARRDEWYERITVPRTIYGVSAGKRT